MIKDIVLVAIASPIEYGIGYEVKYGEEVIVADTSGLPTSFSVEKSVTLGIPTVDDYIFCGWYKDNTCSSNPITSLDISSCKENEHEHNITLYAKLIKIPKITKDYTYKDYTYNGEEQTCDLSFSDDDLNYITVTGNKQTNAGTYTITIKVKNSNVNSNEYYIYPWVIKKKTVTFDSEEISITNATVTTAGSIIEYSDNIQFNFEGVNVVGLISNDIQYTYTYNICSTSISPSINFTKQGCNFKSCTFNDLTTDLTLPIDKYYINISIELNNDNYDNQAKLSKSFNINKLRIYINTNDILTLSPSSDGYNRIWDDVKTYLNNKSNIYRFLDKSKYSKNTLSSCIGMQDGLFKYGNPSVNSSLNNIIKITSFEGDKMDISTNAGDYVIGSTYYAYFEANENYEFVNAENGNNTKIILI